MAQEITIKINAEGNIQGIDKAIKALTELDKQAQATSKKVEKSFSGKFLNGFVDDLKSLPLSFLGVAGSVAGLTSALSKSLDAFLSTEKAMIGLSTVARGVGEDVEAAKVAAQDLASDGLIPLSEVSASLKNLMASGLSLDQATKLFKALKDSASFNRQGFLELGQAVVGATEGIKNGMSILVDNAGITKNLSILEKEYAASIGKTVGQLTEAERIQARYVGILKEASIFTGDAARLSDTLSGKLGAASTAVTRLAAAFGNLVFNNRVFGALVTGVEKLASVLERAAVAAGKLSNFEIFSFMLSPANAANEALANVTKSLFDTNKETKKVADSFEDLSRASKKIRSDAANFSVTPAGMRQAAQKASEETAKQAEATKKVAEELKKLDERYKNFSTSRIKQLENQRDEELKIAQGNAALIVKINQNYNKQIQNEREKDKKDFEQKEKEKAEFAKKIFDELEKIKSGSGIFEDLSIDRITKSTRVAISGSFEGFFDTMADLDGKVKDVESRVGRKLNAQEISDLRRASIQATAKTTAETISQGAEGARKMIVGLGKTAINAIAPGMGEAAGPLLDAFSQGPEATKKMVQDFTSAIPMIIENMIESIPVFLETLADSLPLVVERLAEKADDIALALIKAMPRVVAKLILLIPQIIVAFAKEMPKAAVEFIKGLVSGAGRFVQELINKLTGSSGSNNAGPLGKIPVVGPIISGAIGGIKKIFKFADGGSIYAKQVPSGFPSDSFPARLTSGELVVDRSTAYKLKEFLDDPRMTQPSSDSGLSTALLSQIASLLARPMTIESDVSLDERAFAKILLELNRTNQRLA